MSSKHEQEVKIQDFDNIENIEDESFEERTKVIIVEEYNQGGMAILILNENVIAD